MAIIDKFLNGGEARLFGKALNGGRALLESLQRAAKLGVVGIMFLLPAGASCSEVTSQAILVEGLLTVRPQVSLKGRSKPNDENDAALMALLAYDRSDHQAMPHGWTRLDVPGLTEDGLYRSDNACASTFRHADGRIAVAVRGTDDLVDVVDMSRGPARHVRRFAPLIAAVRDLALTEHVPVLLTGHSLGGEVAIRIAQSLRADGVDVETVAFGSVGRADEHVTSFYLRGDPAALLGGGDDPIYMDCGDRGLGFGWSMHSMKRYVDVLYARVNHEITEPQDGATLTM